MISDRGSRWPLVLGLVVSLSVHVVALPGLTRLAIRRTAKAPATGPTEAPKDRRTPIGKHDATASSVAWISHDDFRRLLARQSVTEQPALQNQVQPVPDAPVPTDPTNPAPPATVAIERTATPQLTMVTDADTLANTGPPLPAKQHGPAVSTSQSPKRPPKNSPIQASDAHPSHTPTENVVHAAAAAPPRRAKPTSAAKTDAESAPTRLIAGTIKVHPGKVIVGEGIEIKPVRPRFSTVTMASAIPNNPRAKITFDAAGRVVDVKMLRSTGYVGFDSPIQASLYKWRATGPRLVELGQGFVIDVELILVK